MAGDCTVIDITDQNISGRQGSSVRTVTQQCTAAFRKFRLEQMASKSLIKPGHPNEH